MSKKSKNHNNKGQEQFNKEQKNQKLMVTSLSYIENCILNFLYKLDFSLEAFIFCSYISDLVKDNKNDKRVEFDEFLVKNYKYDKEYIKMNSFIQSFEDFYTKNLNSSKENDTVEIIYSICPNCGNINCINPDGEELQQFNKVHCRNCCINFVIDTKKEKYCQVSKVEEKVIKLISYKEAFERNILNPGTVLFSYDKRNWMVADSNPMLWSENTKANTVYFTTLSFE